MKLNSILKQNLVEFKDDKGNKNFETKLNDYINKEKIPEIETLQDEQINNSYKSLVNETIENVLKTSVNYPNLYQKWTKILTKLLYLSISFRIYIIKI
jgi:recombinational DNA repair protein (RecF pathway)